MNASTERVVCVRCGREGHTSAQCRIKVPPPPACMGGWCGKRSRCPHYHAEDRREPSERLCVPGADGVGIEQAITFAEAL